MVIVDSVELARDLIRCPSVTPEDAGALGVLSRSECERVIEHAERAG